MEIKKCKLIRVQDCYYLDYCEKQEVKIGDRIIGIGFAPLQIVTGFSDQYGLYGFYKTNYNPYWVKLYNPKIAAIESEIASEDLEVLKEAGKECYILEADGIPLFDNGKILIKFDEKDFQLKVNPK